MRERWSQWPWIAAVLVLIALGGALQPFSRHVQSKPARTASAIAKAPADPPVTDPSVPTAVVAAPRPPGLLDR